MTTLRDFIHDEIVKYYEDQDLSEEGLEDRIMEVIEQRFKRFIG